MSAQPVNLDLESETLPCSKSSENFADMNYDNLLSLPVPTGTKRKRFKTFIKPFQAQQRSVKIKI